MKGSEIIKKLHNALAFFFMVTYLAAQVGTPVHEISHSWQEEEVCSEPENACHLKIVHADLEHGCDHDTHLLEDNSLHCDFCATFTGSKTALIIADRDINTPITSKTKLALTTTDVFGRILRSENPRGPPLYS